MNPFILLLGIKWLKKYYLSFLICNLDSLPSLLFRHTSSDSPETKDVSLDLQESTEKDEDSQANTVNVQESTEKDENSQADTVDLISNSNEPEAESIEIINATKILKQAMPKIKSTNNQVSQKLALKRLYGDFSLPSLRSRRRKRSTVDACVCM